MQIYNFEQQTQEWHDIRRGKFTSSRFAPLMGKKTNKGYTDEIYRVVYERMTGEDVDTFTNKYIQNGIEQEPEARLWYELNQNVFVEQVGFVEHNDWIGSSPDGFVGDKGEIEIKCVKYNTQIDRLITGEFPTEYKWQVQGQLWICEREWCDFISYLPKMKPFIIRIERDDIAIKELEIRLEEVIEETQSIINKLR